MVAEFREANLRQDSLAREVRDLRRVLLDSLSAREGEALSVRGELGRRVGAMRQELRRLEALVGQNQRILTRLQEHLERADAAAGGEEGAEEPVPGDTSDAGTAGDASPDGETGREATPGEAAGSPAELYGAALQQFRRGSYETARSGLEEFLAGHPDHELAPDAQYYVAESFARAGETEPALEAYARVLELFPDSRRAPAALFKSGRLELERGNLEEARSFFSRVVNGYPESDEASLARHQLQQLGGGR